MLRPIYLLPLAALWACRVVTVTDSHSERLVPVQPDAGGAALFPVLWRDASRTDAATEAATEAASDPLPVQPDPPTTAGCFIFPVDNPWNQDITALPVHPNSAAYLAAMNPSEVLQPDWGDWTTNHTGIPINAGHGAPLVPMDWTAPWGPTESDMAPCPDGSSAFCYPIPGTSRIEGGPDVQSAADRHLIYLDTTGAPDHCVLYEIYNAQNWIGPHWTAANGAIFHLDTNALRPDGWTSADEAGLSILAGLVRVEEVLGGEVRHAIRFTMSDTGNGYISPATHGAGRGTANLPPMGLRLRLRADYDTSSFDPAARVIVRAMQRYGIILADTGPDWFLAGDSDDRWAPLFDGINTAFLQIHGSDFEVVFTGVAQIKQ